MGSCLSLRVKGLNLGVGDRVTERGDVMHSVSPNRRVVSTLELMFAVCSITVDARACAPVSEVWRLVLCVGFSLDFGFSGVGAVSSVRGAWPWAHADFCTCVWMRRGVVCLGTHRIYSSHQGRLVELPESQR